MNLYLEGIASLDNEMMVGCVGALLLFFARSQTNEDNDDEDRYRIRTVEAFRMNEFMNLNQDALTSLNIFCDEKHPNMFSSDNKEGLSLFGLMNLTRSSLGKSLLESWFLRPSIDIKVIHARQSAIKEMLLPTNEDRVDLLRESVSYLSNITRICQKLNKKLTLQEWESLLKFSFHSLKIRTACERFSDPSSNERVSMIPVFQKIRQSFDPRTLQEVGSQINTVIDFESSNTETNLVVKLGVDQELDDLKRLFDGMDHLLSNVAHEIAKSIPDEFSDSLNVIYFPQLGYLITIPLQSHMTSQESFIIPGLDFQFCTKQTVFYKSEQMYHMDETMGDVHSIIADREIAVLQSLQASVAQYAPVLIEISKITAELDCLLALAESARKYKFVCPDVVDSGDAQDVLEIVEGRHPLYEQCMDSFIGNYTGLGGLNYAAGYSRLGSTSSSDMSGSVDERTDENGSLRVMLLTGPNFSGKTVYLKQVGLIVFMAHIGSFVPAKSATIGITDRIITRIQAVESDSKIQSAFMIDSQQMAYALRNSTRRSLILIDEYGKGTLHSSGVGLFCACLEEFLGRRDACPKVVATTHFHEIFIHNLLPEIHPCLKRFKMDALPATLENEDRLTFLYRVVPGNASSSLGLYCAKLAGVPEPVLERANEVAECLEKGVALNRASSDHVVGNKNSDSMEEVIRLFKSFDCDSGDLFDLFEAVKNSER
ncbi:muts domain V-domain-containing protein [Obelidium mucronatum]|nr:muts domain V-domain-containing protein [Obelidium mucronatum]